MNIFSLLFSRKKTPVYYMGEIIEKYKEQYAFMFFDNIANELKRNFSKSANAINNNSAYYNNKEVNIEAVEQVVVQLLLQYIDAVLVSGKFHLYRGVLDGSGNKLLEIYKKMLNELIRLNMMDEETQKTIDEIWIKNNIKSLLDDIKTVG